MIMCVWEMGEEGGEGDEGEQGRYGGSSFDSIPTIHTTHTTTECNGNPLLTQHMYSVLAAYTYSKMGYWIGIQMVD